VTGSVGTATTQDIPIYDGHIDGNVITFKWKSPDGDRTMMVTGRINGDEISLTREVQVAHHRKLFRVEQGYSYQVVG